MTLPNLNIFDRSCTKRTYHPLTNMFLILNRTVMWNLPVWLLMCIFHRFMCLFRWFLEMKTLPHNVHWYEIFQYESSCVSLNTFWRCFLSHTKHRDIILPHHHCSSGSRTVQPYHTDLKSKHLYESLYVVPWDEIVATQSTGIMMGHSMTLHVSVYCCRRWNI